MLMRLRGSGQTAAQCPCLLELVSAGVAITLCVELLFLCCELSPGVADKPVPCPNCQFGSNVSTFENSLGAAFLNTYTDQAARKLSVTTYVL